MILVTGGAGYIGSHTVLALLEASYDVIVLDNLCNSTEEAIRRVEKLTQKSIAFAQGDIRDRALLDRILSVYPLQSVLHFAGLKAVGESVHNPLEYFNNNVCGTITLLEAMRDHQLKSIIFSSSATVYGNPAQPAYVETMPCGEPGSPYGRSKLMIEQILTDMQRADPQWSVALLRYFNPAGAHDSGEIGEDPQNIPNNLVPYISQVATGRREELAIFGGDYDTPDGTCRRDYIHVTDLAAGHVKALQHMQGKSGVEVWNLGRGEPSSVLEVLRAYEHAAGKPIPYRIAPRRAGDLAQYWAVAEKAERELGWKAEKTLDDMMRDAWRWQTRNPHGYHTDG